MKRIRELNEQAIEAARAAGLSALDAYRVALESVVDAEEKLADGSHVARLSPHRLGSPNAWAPFS